MMEYKKEDEERIVQNLILGILVTLHLSNILSVVSDCQCRKIQQKLEDVLIYVQSWLYPSLLLL